MNHRDQRITLEDINRRKTEVLQNIRLQQKALTEATQEIFSPFLLPPGQSSHSLISKFNTGMAVFEGVIVGIKFLNRIRNMFSKRMFPRV